MNLINADPSIASIQIRKILFENFEDIQIIIGAIYKILKDNDFRWIYFELMPKSSPEQQKLKMNLVNVIKIDMRMM